MAFWSPIDLGHQLWGHFTAATRDNGGFSWSRGQTRQKGVFPVKSSNPTDLVDPQSPLVGMDPGEGSRQRHGVGPSPRQSLGLVTWAAATPR